MVTTMTLWVLEKWRVTHPGVFIFGFMPMYTRSRVFARSRTSASPLRLRSSMGTCTYAAPCRYRGTRVKLHDQSEYGLLPTRSPWPGFDSLYRRPLLLRHSEMSGPTYISSAPNDS